MSATKSGTEIQGLDLDNPTRYEWRITAKPGVNLLDILAAKLATAKGEHTDALQRIRDVQSPVLRWLSLLGFAVYLLLLMVVLLPIFFTAIVLWMWFFLLVLLARGVGDQVALYVACALALLFLYGYWSTSVSARRRRRNSASAPLCLDAVSAMIAFIAASPVAPVSQGFQGDTHSSWQWGLFLFDQGWNVIFFGIPTYCFGPLSSIVAVDGPARAAVALLRMTMAYGVLHFIFEQIMKPSARVLRLAQNEDYYVGTVRDLCLYLLGNYGGQERVLVISRVGTVTTATAVETIPGEQFAELWRAAPGRK